MKIKQIMSSPKFFSRFGWLIFSLMLFPSVSLATLTQAIDRTDIHAGETFTLTIETDSGTDDEPDLSLIPKDFSIVSTSESQRFSSFNGQSYSTKSWIIQLSTLKTGDVTIPPITLGNERTKSISLFIKDTDSQLKIGANDKVIFLEADVSAPEVYVQQQIIFTLKLYRSVNTHLARLSELAAADSIIEKLGDDTQFYQTINNTRYLVTKIRYAIFPQKSGTLTIDPIVFNADINDPNASRSNFRFLNTTRPISIKSKPLNIIVKPMPMQASEPWMPASLVTLDDQISPNSNEFTLGKPVTWTITLSAQGLSESQLAEIKFPQIAGMQFYPDTPQKERKVSDKGILGKRIEKVAIVPSKQGDFKLPEIKVTWWDIQSNSEKQAIIPARKITVLAPANASPNKIPATIISPTKSLPPNPVIQTTAGYWPYVAALFALLWLMTLWAWLAAKRNRARIMQQTATSVDHKEPSLSNKKLFSYLLNALKQQNVNATEKSLLKWASGLSANTFYSIGELQSKVQDPLIVQKLSALESQRYSVKPTDDIILLNQDDLVKIKSLLTRENDGSEKAKIPPLY